MTALALALVLSQLSVKQDGGTVGPVNAVDCIGPGAQCSRTGSTWKLYVDAGTPVSVPSCDPATQYVVADGGSFGCVTPAASGSPVAYFEIASACSLSPCTLGASSNVTSVTRSATGNYRVNYTTAAATNTRAIICTARANGGTSAVRDASPNGQDVNGFYVWCWEGASLVDCEWSCVVY